METLGKLAAGKEVGAWRNFGRAIGWRRRCGKGSHYQRVIIMDVFLVTKFSCPCTYIIVGQAQVLEDTLYYRIN